MNEEEKRTFLIIFIIFTISYLLYLLYIIDIYSLFRFMRLKYFCSKQYIQDYRHLKKCTNDKVVLSLTTVPERIKKIKPMLNSLLNQTVRVDRIALNIPEKCKNKDYDIPNEYNELCNIFNVGRDYGPGTKYVPTLLREKDCGTKIILLDDDYIYGKDLIEVLLKESEKNPNKCLYIGNDFKTANGILLKPEFIDKVTHNYCDNQWLKDNLKVEKMKIPYKKNYKFI
jgi:hypothetical protein